jgi:hypothetical protein
MDRNTNLRDMDAPGVASGKEAGDTVLSHTAVYPSKAETGSNTLEELVTEKQPVKGASGQAKFK